MRRKLFAFFMMILFFGVTITGIVSYDFMRKWIVDNAESSLKTESALIEEYTKLNNGKVDFDKLANEIKNVIDRRITIIDTKGKVVAESDLSKEKLENHLNRPEIQKALKKGIGSSLRFSATEKIPMYYYAKKTQINGGTYIIRLAIKLNAISKMERQYLDFSIIAIFIGVLISAVLALIYLNYFIKPIKALTGMASAMSLGKYGDEIHISSRDEIGQLGNAFNLLTRKLEVTISDLADKQNKLFSIITSMDDGVVVLDKYKKILLINPAAEKLFNLNYNATGRYFIETIRNNDFNDIIKDIPNEDVEITLNYPTLKHLRIRTTSVINYDVTSEQLGLLMVIQDITKIKALEQMRTDFVANVSHELKTPLTSIKGFAETLKYVEDNETRDKFLDIINVESERLTRLINDILTLSEIESKDFSANAQRIDIHTALKEVSHIMEPVARSKEIELSCTCGDENLFVWGDIDKFKQMIINLVDNAVKYTNNNGKVRIMVSKAGNEARISVEDNGIGISEEHIKRLFERFYRVDKARSRSVGGTGLGLAIVKHIVILLQGRIDIKSELGKGSEFIIYLPLA